MFQHLSNCHGEWNFLFILVSSLPFVGILIRSKMERIRSKDKSDEGR